DVFVTEQADGLADAVFVNRKILLAQVGSEAAFGIAHGGVQHDEIDVDGDLERTLSFLGRRCLKRLGAARQSDQQQRRESQGIQVMAIHYPPSRDAWSRRDSGYHCRQRHPRWHSSLSHDVAFSHLIRDAHMRRAPGGARRMRNRTPRYSKGFGGGGGG